MSEGAQIQSVAKFFLFVLMDETLARQATLEAHPKCQQRIHKLGGDQGRAAAAIVHCTNKVWEKYQKQKSKGFSSISYEGGWILPEGVDTGPWKQFQMEAEADELLATVWSHILKLKDEQIAEGLGVTVGTVRHRVGRALRHLARIQGSFHG